jgi:hypothetical protein
MAVAHRKKRAPRQQRSAAQTQRVSEIIGRASPLTHRTIYNSRFALPSIDGTEPDYVFYDLLRRGKQPGYKLGALFAKRIERIFAHWVLGKGVTLKLAASGADDNPDDTRNVTDALLDDFIEANHALLMTVKEDSLGLGMQYIFINPDGSLSVPSPDTVTEVRDPLDYRRVIEVKITTSLEEGMTVTDVYTLEGRTVTITKGEKVVKVDKYQNMIGRLSYVRIAHAQSSNEVYGHSIHEDLLKLYDQYDDVIHKQLDGAKLLGNPLLTFVGLEDLSAVIDANQPNVNATYYDREGTQVTRPELNVDGNSVLLVGKGGDAKFVSPPVGFTEDTKTALKSLFLLLLDRTGIPEFIWGNEMSSARASSDTQMMQWAQDIGAYQKTDELWLMELCSIWLAWQSILDTTIVVDDLAAEWPPVLDENMELLLKLLQFASTESLLTAKTKLKLLALPVDNIDDEIEQAQAEGQVKADQEMERMKQEIAMQPQPVAPVGEMSHAEVEAFLMGKVREMIGDI